MFAQLRRWAGDHLVLSACVTAAIVMLVHGLTSVVSVLPSVAPGADSAMFVGVLWGIEAALFGGALVAIYFAFSAVQTQRPSKSAFDQLLEELWFGPSIGTALGCLVGAGLASLWLLPSRVAWPWPTGGVEFLPVVTLGFFILSTAVVGSLVVRTTAFLHSGASLRLAEARARTLASEVRRMPRPKIEFSLGGSPARLRRKRSHRRERKVAALRDLIVETRERAEQALVADDFQSVRGELGVWLEAWEASANSTAERELEAHEWVLLLEGPDTIETNFISLLGGADRARTAAWTVHTFPLDLWRGAVRQRDADLQWRALNMLQWFLRSPKRAHRSIPTLIDVWRNYPWGPETFLMRAARTGIRPDGVPHNEITSLIQAALVVDVATLELAVMCALRNEWDAAGEMLASRASTRNIFWPLEAKEYHFSEELREYGRRYAALSGEAALVAVGLLRLFPGGAKAEALCDYVLRNCTEDDFESESQLRTVITLSKEAELNTEMGFNVLGFADEIGVEPCLRRPVTMADVRGLGLFSILRAMESSGSVDDPQEPIELPPEFTHPAELQERAISGKAR